MRTLTMRILYIMYIHKTYTHAGYTVTKRTHTLPKRTVYILHIFPDYLSNAPEPHCHATLAAAPDFDERSSLQFDPITNPFINLNHV
jgi:hypothetical protein